MQGVSDGRLVVTAAVSYIQAICMVEITLKIFKILRFERII